MCKYTVYRHKSPSGKMYVGITKLKPENRWNNGDGYQSQPKFFNAIKKYGWDNFKHEVLLKGLTREQAEYAEKLFIRYWDSIAKGYNIEGGGIRHKEVSKETRLKMSNSHMGKNNFMYGKHHTEKTKQKISKANKGKNIGKNNPNYGKKHTKETRNKISKANKGKIIPKDVKDKISASLGKEVAMIDKKEMKIISIYKSTREAERMTGIPHTNIGECCREKRRSAGGYIWRYV